MPTPRLNTEEKSLLLEVLWQRQPSLVALANTLDTKALSASDLELLREVLIDELTRTGLRQDYEPNERGRRLDALIGRLVEGD